MKQEILELLRGREDFVSGQELCERFGVSRTAVWNAVEQLKKEGYLIEAVRNRGYLLRDSDEVYSGNEIAGRLRTRWAGRPVYFYDSLGSTNLQAKMDAEKGAGHGTLIVAAMQTKGRGRRGRNWSSPAGTTLYFTLILKPDFSPDTASMLTLVMAYAIARGIEKTASGQGKEEPDGLEIGIKWPNDIVVHGKKVCGILTEMSAERDYIHYVVIGCGVNVKKQNFGPEIASTAAALEEELKQKISRSGLLANVMEVFEREYEAFVETGSLKGLKDRYNALLVNRDREVCVLDPKGEYRGVARGINDAGELLVERSEGGLTAVYAGEVSVRGIYGYV